MVKPWLAVIAWLFVVSLNKKPGIKKIQFTGSAQGTSYLVTYYANDTLVSHYQIDSMLQRIDSSLSLYKPYSLINQFNRSTDGLVVDEHFRKVIQKAIIVHSDTKGLFDITIYPLTDAWGFGPQKKESPPNSALVNQLRSCVNTELLSWSGKKLVKKQACVQLDANGIAQGYSVDVVADFLQGKGIQHYLVEIGGEIRIKGRKYPENKKMSVGIEAPGDDPYFSVIDRVVWLDKGAITTSGNYRRYYESGGKKITHLLDPRSGYPVQNELISVTVYAPDAITADAYDNALMTMGLQQALAFVEKRKQLAAHFIYRKKDGTVADTMSKRFRVLLQP